MTNIFAAVDAPLWAQVALQVLAPGGVAAVAVKIVLNGTKERVKEIHEDVKEIRQEAREIRDAYHGVVARVWLLEEKSRAD